MAAYDVKFTVEDDDVKYLDESLDTFARVVDGVDSGDDWRVSERDLALLRALFGAVLDGSSGKPAAFRVPRGIAKLGTSR